MTTTVKTIKTLAALKKAEAGSYYTISGAGGDLNEWVQGYEDLLEEAEIGKPKEWFQTTGSAVNEYVSQSGLLSWRDAFPLDTVFLMFPLDGLDIGKLAIFKIKMQDRWFDDIVQNMRQPL